MLVLTPCPNHSGVHPSARLLVEGRSLVPVEALHIVHALAGADLKDTTKRDNSLGFDFEWFALLFHCAYSLIDIGVDYKNYLLILWYDSGYQPDKVFQNTVEVGGLPDLTTTTGASLKGHRKPLVSPAVNDDGPGTGATGGGVLVAREHETEFIGEDVELFVIHYAYSIIDDADKSKKNIIIL